jgi:hypothetical protein
VNRLALALLLAGVFSLASNSCNVGTLSKDPTTPDPGWPADDPTIDGPVLAAAGGSSCATAIENTKHLACGFQADDPAAWCATLTAAQVKCVTGAKNCLAQRTCTEPKK